MTTCHAETEHPAAPSARIQAISLDLDDTLWPVWPAIEQAEAELLAWMQAHTPAAARRWAEPGAARAWRAQVEAAHPQRAHDLSFLRLQTITLAMQAAGEQAAPQRAQQAFEVFFAARQRVQLFAEVAQALDWLAARYPLLALSNGNADVLAMPMGRCFADRACSPCGGSREGLKNRSDQGARYRAYVDTPKTGNAERGDFSGLPEGLGPAGAAHGIGNPRKASSLAAVAALCPAPAGSNAVSLRRVNRPSPAGARGWPCQARCTHLQAGRAAPWAAAAGRAARGR